MSLPVESGLVDFERGLTTGGGTDVRLKILENVLPTKTISGLDRTRPIPTASGVDSLSRNRSHKGHTESSR